MSISKNIGDHIKLSALHSRFHLFSMSKIKWIFRHVIFRLIVVHLVILWVMLCKATVLWMDSWSWPFMKDSHIYIKAWVNVLAGIGWLLILVGLVVGGMLLVISFFAGTRAKKWL